MNEQRTDYGGMPLEKAVILATRHNSSMSRQLKYLLATDENPAQSFRDNTRHRITTATSSKVLTYRYINPDLHLYPVYSKHTSSEEYKRTAVTRPFHDP